jgi:hypothetical protein
MNVRRDAARLLETFLLSSRLLHRAQVFSSGEYFALIRECNIAATRIV